MRESQGGREVWFGVLFGLLLLAGLALLVLGVYLAFEQREYTVLALALLTIVVTASAYALAGREQQAELLGQLQDQNRLLDLISERLLISDQAKRIAYRQKDRETLREAILEDIRIEDYEAALVLANDMAEIYGYRQEAEDYRQQILQAQAQKRESLIQQATSKLDKMLEQHEWNRARAEVDRMLRIYPDSPSVTSLPKRIRQAQQRHKDELERAFLEAAEREEVERAMELLKELDMYLSPEEAAPYVEMARGVIGKKKANLGVRFKLSVQDRDWIGALSVGEQIVREFPNSMFATEVRGLLDTLRERATGQRAAMAQK